MGSSEMQLFGALSVRVCPTCGKHYEPTARFCAVDGTALHAARPSDPLIGREVDGFRIRRPLAAGGMGRVYLADELATGRLCALKVLDAEVAREPAMLRRFDREATNHARLGAHPHVCALIRFGSTPDGVVYIAMDYVAGEPLSALLRAQGFLAPRRVAEIVRQAANGLAAAHALELVHRDLKPENIMLGTGPTGGDHVTLIDFGIAKSMMDRRQKLTGTGVAVGTPLFMSPEQLTADVVDARSDTYSLGLLAYLMLTGVMPYPVNSPASVMLRVTGQLQTLADARPTSAWPAALQAALDGALQPDPAARHASVDAFARDLGAAIAEWESRRAPSAGLADRAPVPTPAGMPAVLPAIRVRRSTGPSAS